MYMILDKMRIIWLATEKNEPMHPYIGSLRYMQKVEDILRSSGRQFEKLSTIDEFLSRIIDIKNRHELNSYMLLLSVTSPGDRTIVNPEQWNGAKNVEYFNVGYSSGFVIAENIILGADGSRSPWASYPPPMIFLSDFSMKDASIFPAALSRIAERWSDQHSCDFRDALVRYVRNEDFSSASLSFK